MARRQELTPRRAAILGAVVEEYIETAAPVGSKAVHERYGVEASPATIRNEMGVLETTGYIRQPHTSAGRIPADKGYRAYVDGIMSRQAPGPQVVAWVRGECRRASHDREELYRTTSRMLSQITSAPAMLMAPPDDKLVLTDIKLTAVSSRIILLACNIDPLGSFEALIESTEAITADQVERLGTALARCFCGRAATALSLCPTETLEHELAPSAVGGSLLAQTLEEIKTAVEQECPQRVYVDGAAYALDYPEYERSERLKPVMKALDEEGTVRRLLRPAATRAQLTVTIGGEQEMSSLRQCSLVADRYGTGAEEVGVIGVIGPTRMHYRAVIGAVKCLADQIGEALGAARQSEQG